MFTQTKRLAQAAEEAADAVATMLAIDPANVEVTLDLALPGEVATEVNTARTLVAEAERAQRAAAKKGSTREQPK